MRSKYGALLATALLFTACGQEDDGGDFDAGLMDASHPVVAADAGALPAMPDTGTMIGAAGDAGMMTTAPRDAGRDAAPGIGSMPGRDAGAADGSVAADAASDAAAAAVGDGGAYSPCPSDGPCKILPLGDSITYGIGFSGGYRVQLFHLATMNMKKITYVGSLMNGPQMVDGMPFPRKHEGTSGITIGGLDGRIPTPGLNEIPHIVLLHIGTNDMYMTPAGAPDRLGTLIDGIVMGAPDALIVVAKIIPLASGGSAVETYNNAIPAVVQKRIDAGKHVVLIDQFTGFPTSELGDGVHPNEAGYSRMADKWYDAISKYLR
jgi:hypothetical protein